MKKTCRICFAEKDISMFEAHRKLCKECRSAQVKEYALKNRDKWKIYSARVIAKNPEAHKQYHKEYRKKHADKLRKAMRVYMASNKETLAAKKAVRYKENAEMHRIKNSENHVKNRESRLIAQREYRRKNRPVVLALRAKYRASKIQATPKWYGELDSFVFREAYALCALRYSIFGFKWHVDHVIPLQGDKVCGFHVYNNIAVIPATENIAKGNKYANNI